MKRVVVEEANNNNNNNNNSRHISESDREHSPICPTIITPRRRSHLLPLQRIEAEAAVAAAIPS